MNRPRFDSLGPIHKTIRLVLSELLLEMGTASFDDASTSERVLRELDEVLDFCSRHIHHEETFLRPACAGRVGLEIFDNGHPAHERQIAELRALASTLRGAPEERRAQAGRALYVHFAGFVGDTLLHMAEEEQVLMPLLHRAFTDEELIAIQQRLLASMSPAELARDARLMLRAVNRGERAALVSSMLASAPRDAVVQLIESARPTLPAHVFAEVSAIVEAA